jgi:uncharacterized membrane protein
MKTLIRFIISLVAGWLLEVCYRSFSALRFLKPGFLNGFYLAIYGVGMLLVATGHYLISATSYGSK